MQIVDHRLDFFCNSWYDSEGDRVKTNTKLIQKNDLEIILFSHEKSFQKKSN